MARKDLYCAGSCLSAAQVTYPARMHDKTLIFILSSTLCRYYTQIRGLSSINSENLPDKTNFGGLSSIGAG
jgi:hypothetical protein